MPRPHSNSGILLAGLVCLGLAAAPASAERAVVHRFLNELDSAQIALPDLARSARSLATAAYYVHANPHSPATGGRQKLDLLLTLHPGKKVFDERRVLYLPPPGTITYRFRVPANAMLEFGVLARGRVELSVAVERPGAAPVLLHSGLVPPFRATIQDDDGTDTNDTAIGGYQAELRRHERGIARMSKGSKPWRDARIDLSRFAGEEVALTFRTSGAPPSQAFISDPLIVGDAPTRRDNVLVIVVDTLRADAVGCLGNPRRVTPHIDRICARGTAFTNAFTNGNWTKPSINSFFTSEYPTRTGLNFDAWWFNPGERDAFYARRPPLWPLAFARAGYITAGIMNNLFAQGFHRFGIDVGFDRSVDHRHSFYDTPYLTSRAVDFITENRDRPWFLYMHMNAPHQMYIPPAKYKAQVRLGPGDKTPDQLQRYYGEVAYTDDYAGRVLKAVEDLGLTNRTLIVITGDHGETMDRRHHYRVTRTGRQSLYSHGVTLYDEELHVPLIIAKPGAVPAGKRIDSAVPLIDVGPTVLELAGLPADARHQGQSLAPLWRDGALAVGDRPIYSEGKGTRALRLGGWKLFLRLPGYEHLERDGRSARTPEELFELAKDPVEHVNLVHRPEAKPMLERLRSGLKRYRDEVAVRVATAAGTVANPQGAPGAERARYHLLASGDAGEHRFTGEIYVDGAVSSVRPVALHERSGVWPEGHRLLVDLRIGQRASGVVFDVTPATAKVVLSGVLDGKPVSPENVFIGRLGIGTASSASPGVRIDQAPALDTTRAPKLRPGGELGLFVWRVHRDSGSGAGVTARRVVSADFEKVELPGEKSGEAANNQVEKALREWGYIQAGEKEPKR